MCKQISQCRICGSRRLELVLDLGIQMLTGVFPREAGAKVTEGPLRLVKCSGDGACGLLQLQHSYDLGQMYGANYGYRSGLNQAMVHHLRDKVKRILGRVALTSDDLVVDIGSNDGTTLRAYPEGPLLVGIDPTGAKFRDFYPPHVMLLPDFFSASLMARSLPGKKAKVVTSFSMFYDLESPMNFMQEVHDLLADDGIWVFEQSYMPSMLQRNSFDTVCHEHLEYYGLRQIKWMTDRVGFRIVDVEFNDVNGGSFSVTVEKSSKPEAVPNVVQQILERELYEGLDTLNPYLEFSERVFLAKLALARFFEDAKKDGRTVVALGASTKGNVLLQYCGLSGEDIVAVGEVNPDKFGCYTPGTWIPIVPEAELLQSKPDYLLVLPWHFRDFFLSSSRFTGTRMVFPLPNLEIVCGKLIAATADNASCLAGLSGDE